MKWNFRRPPAQVVYGVDQNGKPRAAIFPANHAEAAREAAQTFGFNLCEIANPAGLSLAHPLPVGSTADLPPEVSFELLEELTALFPVSNPPMIVSAASASSDQSPQQRILASWDQIAIGDLVLAKDHSYGWFEAIVLEQEGETEFRLRFRDYPREGIFSRHRNELGLLPIG